MVSNLEISEGYCACLFGNRANFSIFPGYKVLKDSWSKWSVFVRVTISIRILSDVGQIGAWLFPGHPGFENSEAVATVGMGDVVFELAKPGAQRTDLSGVRWSG